MNAREEIIKDLQEYIDNRFENINKARCQELVDGYRTNLIFPHFAMFLASFSVKDSYHNVRDSFLGKECKERFCKQLSDQLVFCEGCGQRPILYNVIRDEDSVERHLRGHQRSQVEVEETEKIERMLLEKLTVKLSEYSEKGFDRRNI